MKAHTVKLKHEYLQQLLHTEDTHLLKLHELVTDAMQEQELLVRKIGQNDNEERSFGQRIADRVAAFGGSWTFIISFLLILGGWITLNVLMATRAFDPYPFILLNLILSCIAALQAPVIMMSQNRQEEKDRQRAENDYMVNLKAEIEIRNLHQKINLLMEEQFKTLLDVQRYQVELLEEIAGKKK